MSSPMARGDRGTSRPRLRALATLLVGATLALACATPPPVAVHAARGIVRADDLASARWFAEDLERQAARLEQLDPSTPMPALEVWVLEGFEERRPGYKATADPRAGWWRIRIDALSGIDVLGHELVHARYHEQLRDWPAALEEGLADRFGLADDLLGEVVATERLFLVARRPLPDVALRWQLHDRTFEGLRLLHAPATFEGAPPLPLARIGTVSRAELDRISGEEQAYVYAVGYAVAVHGLGDVVSLPPGRPPRWSDVAPAEDELVRWAAAQLTDERVRRWSIGRLATELLDLLGSLPPVFASADECLAGMDFSSTVDDDPERLLNGDPLFREMLHRLWPLVASRGRP